MLNFPVVGDVRMIVGEAQFIGGVVMAIGEIHELNRLDPESFVAVRDARRYQDFPGLEAARRKWC